MKRTLFAINYGVAIALCATIWAACSSSPSKTGAADDTDSIADTTAVAPQDTDVVAQEPYHLDFTLKNLLDLLYHHGDYELIENSGMKFIYEASLDMGEVEGYELVYGRDIEKGEKKEFGYELKATSPHGFFFEMSFDTSTQASLSFASQDDANTFIETVLNTEPFPYEDKTFYVHPKQQDDGQYIHLQTPYGDDDFETRYVLYPPRPRDGFILIEIEVYV